MPVTINGSNTPTAGGVTYGDGTQYATTAAGTSGQLLQSNGASAPSWVAAPSSAMTLITTTTASNSATVDFTGLTSAYKNYMVIAEHVVPGTNWQSLIIRTSTNNGSSYSAGSTDYNSASGALGSAWGINYADYSGIFISAGVWSTSNYGGVSFTANIPNPTNASYTHIYGNGYTYDYSQGQGPIVFGGFRNSTSGGVNAIRFIFTSGNIASGTFKLYGIS